MAYRRTSGRRSSGGGYRTRASRARNSGARRSGYARGVRRSTARRVTGSRQQTVKIVLETRPQSAVSRPEIAGVPMVEKSTKRAKF